MTDPRYTDPRYNEPRGTDPRTADPLVVSRTTVREGGTGVWGWIAGFAVLALIAFAIVAGWNNNPTTADNSPAATRAPITTGSSAPVRNVTPPSTTGSGAASPTAPAPSAPSSPAPAPQQQ